MVNISNEQFLNLNKLVTNSSLINVGGTLHHFYLDEKHMIIKKLPSKEFYPYAEEDDNSVKFSVIDDLIDNKYKFNMKELVLPKDCLSIENIKVGYIMDYIDGDDLGYVLRGYNYPDMEKRNCLKQIGLILEKMKLCRDKYLKGDFFLGDLHEKNFVLDGKSNTVKVIDLDSCKFLDNKPSQSKYLYFNNFIYEMDKKYPVSKDNIDVYIPSENTDLLCYHMIILNYIANSDMYNISRDNYYEYLYYLKSIGINDKLLDSFNNLYSNNDNTNPYELIEELPTSIGRANYKVFQYLKKKN